MEYVHTNSCPSVKCQKNMLIVKDHILVFYMLYLTINYTSFCTYRTHRVLTCAPLPPDCVFFCVLQLFQVSSANEWKTINVRDMFAESDEDVLVKCSTWTADGKRVICAAKNAALVSERLLEREYSDYEKQRRDAGLPGELSVCDKEGVNGLGSILLYMYGYKFDTTGFTSRPCCWFDI